MTAHFPKVEAKPRNLLCGFVSLAMLSGAAIPAHAEDDCIDVQSTSAVPDFKPCETLEPDLSQADLNSVILESSASKVKKPARSAYSVPWIANSPQEVPATFSTSDTGVSVKTSLGTLREFNARTASPSIEQPSYGPAPKTNFALPQAPVLPKSPLDVWTSVDVNGFDGQKDQSTRTGVGADYKYSKSTKFGVSVERGDTHAYNTSGVSEDQKASAYVNLQATPLFSLDARSEWQTGNAEFAASSGAAERGAVILAPKINHDIKMDNGTTLSPYVSYQREFDMSTSHAEGVDTSFSATQSAGAGVTYTKPDAYSLSVSADVDNFGAADQAQSLSSKFKLSVPLNK